MLSNTTLLNFFNTALTSKEIWDLIKSICLIPAGIAVFLLGMKMMGDALEKGAGTSIKKMFARIGNNRFAGVGIGAGTTAIIQSSSATTVMVVGFVNAGIMTLFQATAIIMGANIGTTITAYLGVVADLPISSFFMAAGIVGIFMYMFGKRKKTKIAGEIITGLAIIFAGMYMMGNAFRGNAMLENAFKDMFESLSENPVGPLLLVLVGALFTGLVQSSSVTTVMVVKMAGDGIIPVSAALFIVMGANIGTCITALIASIGTSTNAKRAALIHLAFNIIGTIIFVPVVWLLQSGIINVLDVISGNDPTVQVALFHTFFNLTTSLMLIGFIKYLTAFATKIIRGKTGEENDEPKLYFIDEKLFAEAVGAGISAKPALNASGTTIKAADASEKDTQIPVLIDLILKETLNMAELARANLETAFRATISQDDSLKTKIVSTEQKINFINKEIGRYLIRLAKEPIDKHDRKLINSLHNVVSDIERIGDHAVSFLDDLTEMRENDVKFSDAAIKELEEMYLKVSNIFVKALEVFKTRNVERLPEVVALEKEVDDAKHNLGYSHVSRLNKGECSVESGAFFYEVVTGLERISDHLANIAFSIKSTSGAQLETLKRLSKEKQKGREKSKNIYW